jgi:predicted nucleic acid-binding Zn ribbon protein
MEIIGKVQEKALKMTSRLKGESCEERCKEVGLENQRRGRSHKIWPRFLKIVEGIDELDSARRQYQNTRMSANPWNLD